MHTPPQLHTLFPGLILVALLPCAGLGQRLALDSTHGLQPHNVTLEPTSYLGRKAIRVLPSAAADGAWESNRLSSGGGVVVVPNLAFHNGTIELKVSGKPRAGAVADARGFVGIAFRVSGDASKYECFYIRPTNGRADNQLRRNHSTQYMSFPEYEWSRLRKEAPGQYESYVDLVPGVWTPIKVEVSGSKAQLYVGGSSQPVLIVNDLKLGDTSGSVALWIGQGTEAYFCDLRVSR